MKKLTLILIIIFSLLAIDLPVMLAYQSSLSTLHFSNPEQTNTLRFLENKEPLLVDYTEDEISHLEDVKKLMSFANFYFIFLLVVEILILIIIFQTEKKEFYKTFLYGGIVSTSILLLTVLWALADFSSLFNLFHQSFFQAGTWVFDSSLKLVNLFPVSFFFKITKEIFIKALIFSIIFIILGLYLKKKRK